MGLPVEEQVYETCFFFNTFLLVTFSPLPVNRCFGNKLMLRGFSEWKWHTGKMWKTHMLDSWSISASVMACWVKWILLKCVWHHVKFGFCSAYHLYSLQHQSVKSLMPPNLENMLALRIRYWCIARFTLCKPTSTMAQRVKRQKRGQQLGNHWETLL